METNNEKARELLAQFKNRNFAKIEDVNPLNLELLAVRDYGSCDGLFGLFGDCTYTNSFTVVKNPSVTETPGRRYVIEGKWTDTLVHRKTEYSLLKRMFGKPKIRHDYWLGSDINPDHTEFDYCEMADKDREVIPLTAISPSL
ncbi:MAG: hypothetical protein PHH54_00360 [Candidatus Nanoarchaeia archaeon]|nr:hypothetical protein [Candidatus Nanoarchaeia archaeon]MDD5740415.1 hypothetical protein [Candidatus Nanoarchaeia archaeon]